VCNQGVSRLRHHDDSLRLVVLPIAIAICCMWSAGVAHAGANIPINGEVRFSCLTNSTPVPVSAFTFSLDGNAGVSGSVSAVWKVQCGAMASNNCQPFPTSPSAGAFPAFPLRLVWDGTTKMLSTSAYSNPTYHYGYGVDSGLNHSVSGAYTYTDSTGSTKSCVVIPPFMYTGQLMVTLPTATPGFGVSDSGNEPSRAADSALGLNQAECDVALGLKVADPRQIEGFHRRVRFAVWGLSLSPGEADIDERLRLLVGDNPLLREDPLVDTIMTLADGDRSLDPLVCVESDAAPDRVYVTAVTWAPRTAWSGSGSGSTVYALIGQDALSDVRTDPGPTATPSRRFYLPVLQHR